jgi:hypothetical protein
MKLMSGFLDTGVSTNVLAQTQKTYHGHCDHWASPPLDEQPQSAYIYHINGNKKTDK